jgi:hypothetical protein
MYLYIYIYIVQALKRLFVVVKDNKVILYGTNLKDFVQDLNDMKISNRNYQYFYRKFLKGSFTENCDDGFTYYYQQLK